MSRVADVTTSWLASTLELGAGLIASHPVQRRPEKHIIIYEFEGCPFCRRLRESLSAFDLDVEIRPCPKGGTRFRPDVVRRGGKEMFPYMIDPNENKEMYESKDIAKYIAKTYGDGSLPPWLYLGPVGIMLGSVASLTRVTKSGVRPSKKPAQPLELWSFEASPYCRIAREALCALELPYILHNVAKKSPQRAAFKERSGRMMVPYLVDPNTGKEMFESADIVSYLNETYAA